MPHSVDGQSAVKVGGSWKIKLAFLSGISVGDNNQKTLASTLETWGSMFVGLTRQYENARKIIFIKYSTNLYEAY